MLGTATPLVGSGSATPVVPRSRHVSFAKVDAIIGLLLRSHGVHSISGVSSLTSGMDTPRPFLRGSCKLCRDY